MMDLTAAVFVQVRRAGTGRISTGRQPQREGADEHFVAVPKSTDGMYTISGKKIAHLASRAAN